jgi:hypothetical protein
VKSSPHAPAEAALAFARVMKALAVEGVPAGRKGQRGRSGEGARGWAGLRFYARESKGGTKRGDDKWDPHGDRVIASLLDYL